MEHDRRHGLHYVNGMSRPGEKKRDRNYKLIVDPFLHKGHTQKVYRFDGVVPGENRVISTRDPRSRFTRLWTRQQQADLPVPKFKYDEYYVGVPPPKDVSFTNLNDNINKDFLENMCKGCGKIEECKIYYHPKTKKHLGIGKVLFSSSKAARACVDKLNQTSKMGNIINVFIDTLGKERNRLFEELTSEHPRHLGAGRRLSPGRRGARMSESSYTDNEAYDPADSFEMGLPDQEYTPSVSTDYSGYSEGGYSVPQSEMSYSSQDTGYSSGNSAVGRGYQRDSYNHYPIDQSANTSHSGAGGNSYYREQQYRGNHSHQQHHHHHRQHQHHHSRHVPHRPPLPSHQPPPLPPSHFPHDMDKNQYGFYAPPPPAPKTRYECPPPPLPPEPQPPQLRHSDRNYRDSHHGSERSRYSHSERRKKSKEPKPPPRLPSPEPNSDEPRAESLESRIQSLLQNAPGMGSPDHTSSSSQDESTPSHTTARESPFEFYPPPPADPLPSLTELSQDTEEEQKVSPHGTPGNRDTLHVLVQNDESCSHDQFESQLTDGQTVVEETVDTEICATPNADSVQNSTEVPQPPLPESSRERRAEKGADDEDDRMSLSSISSGEEKLEINPPLPPSTPASNTATSSSFTQSPMASVPASSTSTVTPPWQGNMYSGMNPGGPFVNFMGSPPLPGLPGNSFQNGVYGIPGFPPGQAPGTLEEKEDPNDKTFATVLDRFVKELKTIMQKDLCKKMVENSAFKAFEAWWDCEVQKSKKSLLAEKEPEAVPSSSTAVRTKADIKPEMSSSLASLFESRERGGLDNNSMGYGGFLGIRGGMPKLPSFKRKFRPPSPNPEEDEDSRQQGVKSGGEEESDDEEAGSKQKPLISESEEESDSSDEEKEEASADEDGSDDDGSEESSDEEESEESEESDEESDAEEDEDGVETTAKPSQSEASGVKPEEKRDEEKMDVEDSEKSDEDEDVDVGTEAEVGELSASDKETSHRDEDSEKSSMDTDEESSGKDTSVKETPEKPPLSPILEEEEAEELAAKADRGDNSSLPQASTPSAAETSTTTTTTSTDSSAVESDSNAVIEAKSESHIIRKGKRGKSRVSTSSSPASAKDATAAVGSDISSVSERAEAQEAIVPDDDNVCVEEEVQDSETSQKLSESEAEQRSSFMVPAIAEHDYFSFPPAQTEESTRESDNTESADEDSEALSEVLVDHNYSLPPIIEQVTIGKAVMKKDAVISPKPAKESKKKARTKKSKTNTLADITNRPEEKVSRELANLLTPVKPLPKFKCRTFQEERQIFFDIYDRGISEEDVKYLKRTYDELIQSDDPNFYWLNDILWVDHTHTDIPDIIPAPAKKRKKTEEHIPKPHKSGCARTEGYYKLTMREKAGYLRHAHNLQIQQKAAEDMKKIQETGKKAQTSREARHHNRRLQTTYSDLETDLLRFNQLKFRKKQLKFAKSGIHDWGLFALEPIAAEEMVIEYVGQVVRQSIADEREKRYEAIGIGSSYLFRVDTETIIDATKTGNLARFINHSCNPNCYAKIITVESEKKIVIYSKRDIDVNEEITYDYKFPIEDEKIPCLCGAPGCRGTLN